VKKERADELIRMLHECDMSLEATTVEYNRRFLAHLSVDEMTRKFRQAQELVRVRRPHERAYVEEEEVDEEEEAAEEEGYHLVSLDNFIRMGKWSEEDDAHLLTLHSGKVSIPEIAEILERAEYQINLRLKFLNP
jgi:hypothetical protein